MGGDGEWCGKWHVTVVLIRLNRTHNLISYRMKLCSEFSKSAQPWADNPYLDLDYSGCQKDLIQ